MSHEEKEKNKVIILNGTKVWFALLMFVITHGGVGVWWAATLNNTVSTLKENIVEIKQDIKDLKHEKRINNHSRNQNSSTR